MKDVSMSSSNGDTLNFNVSLKVKGKKRKGKKERKGRRRERGWGGKKGKKISSSKENQKHVHITSPWGYQQRGNPPGQCGGTSSRDTKSGLGRHKLSSLTP